MHSASQWTRRLLLERCPPGHCGLNGAPEGPTYLAVNSSKLSSPCGSCGSWSAASCLTPALNVLLCLIARHDTRPAAVVAGLNTLGAKDWRAAMRKMDAEDMCLLVGREERLSPKGRGAVVQLSGWAGRSGTSAGTAFAELGLAPRALLGATRENIRHVRHTSSSDTAATRSIPHMPLYAQVQDACGLGKRSFHMPLTTHLRNE